MRKVNFKTIHIKNFLSVGEESINIEFLKGINLITGENLDNGTRNGVGKSSVIEAIYWCLFGTTLRDIKSDKIIHNQNKKGCEVILNFSVEGLDKNVVNYCINRSLGPSKIQILCDDKDVTLSTIPKNDEFIKSLINANEELFTNAVIMTANSTLPFMAQKKVDKRKFLEAVFNLNIFTEMLLKARGDFNEVKKEHDLLCNSFLNEQRNLEIFEKQSSKRKEQKIEKIKNFNIEIAKCETEIKEIKNKNFNLDEIQKHLNDNEEKIKKLTTALAKIQKDVLNLNTQSTEFKTRLTHLNNSKNEMVNKNEICPLCNRKYTTEEINLVKKKIAEYTTQITEDQQNKEKIDSDIKNLNIKKSEIDSLIEKLRNKNNVFIKQKQEHELKEQKIKNLESKIQDYKKFIKETEDENDDTQEEIKKIQDNIKKLEIDLQKIKLSLAILENVKFVLSEEGVKTYIINKLLDVLNTKLNYYLKRLDSPCTCLFNDQFEETIVNLNNKECSYFNFSGGERKRIDLAILFMFQDILRFYSNTFFSLSMYDELFDSAIDESGIEKVIEILRERVDNNNESVYIVSHNKSSLKNSFNNVLHLQKKKGKTSISS